MNSSGLSGSPIRPDGPSKIVHQSMQTVRQAMFTTPPCLWINSLAQGEDISTFMLDSTAKQKLTTEKRSTEFYIDNVSACSASRR